MRSATLILMVLLIGCQDKQQYSPTKGEITVECDESIYPVMFAQADDFQRTYPEASVGIRSVEAREATVNFLNDSVRVIILARPLNDEESTYVHQAGISFNEYKIALDAIAVVTHRKNPQRNYRIMELDSIFGGQSRTWSGQSKGITVALSDLNSSVEEVFQSRIMGGKPLTPAARRFASSTELLEFVKNEESAIGIVGINWVEKYEKDVQVCNVGDPFSRPDSTQVIDQYYSPVQANIYRRYYPITRVLYIYSREVFRNPSVGFISFVTSAQGQKIFVNHNLVPATMPVRLVQLTSKQVLQ